MAEKILVKAVKRDTRGKNENRRLRVAGKIPIVVYGGGSTALAATADLKDLAAIIRTDSGVNTLFSLDIEGEGINDVIFQARQIDPVRGRLIHADLRRFSKGEKIEMTVPIRLIGHPAGLNEEGAVLTQALREIKVMCEPKNTPDAIDVDISEMAVGHAIHVADLKVGEGIELLEPADAVVASIASIKESDLEPQLETGVAPEVVGEPDETEE